MAVMLTRQHCLPAERGAKLHNTGQQGETPPPAPAPRCKVLNNKVRVLFDPPTPFFFSPESIHAFMQANESSLKNVEDCGLHHGRTHRPVLFLSWPLKWRAVFNLGFFILMNFLVSKAAVRHFKLERGVSERVWASLLSRTLGYEQKDRKVTLRKDVNVEVEDAIIMMRSVIPVGLQLFALLPVLGGDSGVMSGLISKSRSLLVLTAFLLSAAILARSFVPRFLKLMVRLSVQVVYKNTSDLVPSMIDPARVIQTDEFVLY